MPELPEVETIKKDLETNLIGSTITGIDLLWPGIIKDMAPNTFQNKVIGAKVTSVTRRAKNLIVQLSSDKFLLFHMKMTGHLIFADSCWQVDKSGRWLSVESKKSPMHDPLNQYIRIIFRLDNPSKKTDKILAFSDLRKFAYVKLLDKKHLALVLDRYGPEPFSEKFNTHYLQSIFSKKSIAIKKMLMDQALIAGIGNIYADEILWAAKIHPQTPANKISVDKIELLHKTIQDILKKAIEMRGTSTSDFRDTSGKKGSFGNVLNVYRKTGQPCPRDGTPIKRITVGGRGTHFCPTCQKEGSDV